MDGISKETFHQMDANTKLDALFDYTVDANQIAKEVHKTVEKLAESVRQKRKIDTTVAGMMGFVGGLIGSLGRFILPG